MRFRLARSIILFHSDLSFAKLSTTSNTVTVSLFDCKLYFFFCNLFFSVTYSVSFRVIALLFEAPDYFLLAASYIIFIGTVNTLFRLFLTLQCVATASPGIDRLFAAPSIKERLTESPGNARRKNKTDHFIFKVK